MNDAISPLISFYQGRDTDHQGHLIGDIWALSPFWLEHTHDYVQWLFPLPEASRFNSFAPLLSDDDRHAFAENPTLRQRQRHSLDVMLMFFGLIRGEDNAVTALPDLNIREHIWLKRGGHNHLRISRIIRSLHLCHQPELAAAFQQTVITLGTTQGVVSEQSLAYWRHANQQ